MYLFHNIEQIYIFYKANHHIQSIYRVQSHVTTELKTNDDFSKFVFFICILFQLSLHWKDRNFEIYQKGVLDDRANLTIRSFGRGNRRKESERIGFFKQGIPRSKKLNENVVLLLVDRWINFIDDEWRFPWSTNVTCVRQIPWNIHSCTKIYSRAQFIFSQCLIHSIIPSLSWIHNLYFVCYYRENNFIRFNYS